MKSTLEFYRRGAREIAAGYEAVDFSHYLDKTIGYLPAGARVLDLACGSGRDAAAMLRAGFDVVAADGSGPMLDQAKALHPELAGRTKLVTLPQPLPFDDQEFDAVTSWATIMHLLLSSLAFVFSEFHRVIRVGGLFAYAVNTARSGLDESGLDEKGRLFTCMGADEWEGLHVGAGFQTLSREETQDVTGRPGVRWVTFWTRRMSGE